MEPVQSNAGLLQLLPLAIVSVVFGFVARALAKDKGRDVPLWTVLGFIPVVNILFAWFFVGASNLRIERKLDALLRAQGQDPESFKRNAPAARVQG
jgi:hypothetical protein